MKKTIIAALVLLALLLAGCGTTPTIAPTQAPTQEPPAQTAEANATPAVQETAASTAALANIDMAAGKDAQCFAGLDAEPFALEVVQKGETKNLEFEGVTLAALLAKLDITSFTQIELDVSDMDEPVDITDMALAEAGVFLAWSESGEAETPMRVFPADAETGNLLTRNVTGIIIK